MIGPMLIQSQIPVETCDLIQYRRGGAPWATWQDLPAVPAGYLARGPWVCLGEVDHDRHGGLCDEGWLWARALDIDEQAEERSRQETAERSEGELRAGRGRAGASAHGWPALPRDTRSGCRIEPGCAVAPEGSDVACQSCWETQRRLADEEET